MTPQARPPQSTTPVRAKNLDSMMVGGNAEKAAAVFDT
jgi:hypothetical protein